MFKEVREMQVVITGKSALVFNDYGQVTKIEGYVFTVFIREYAQKKSLSKKTEKRILNEMVEAWDACGNFTWIDVVDANV